MPIYEFRCRQCGKKNEFITFRVSEPVPTVCAHCGGEGIERMPSRVRVRMSEETRLERLADPSRLGGIDENDPRSVAKMMKAMTREMGDDMDGDMDVDALVEEAMEESQGGMADGAMADGAADGGADDGGLP